MSVYLFKLKNKFDGFMYVLDHVPSRVLFMVLLPAEQSGADKDGVPAIVRFQVRSLNIRFWRIANHVEVRDLYPLLSGSFSHELFAVVEGGFLRLPVKDHIDSESIVGLEDAVHACCEHLGPVPGHREGVRPH